MFDTFPISEKTYFYSFCFSFCFSIILTKALIATANGSNSVADFMRNKVIIGKKNVMTFGGIAVVISFISTIWIFHYMDFIDNRNINLYLAVSFSIVLMFIVGIYDDIAGSSPRDKMAIQIIIACVVYFAGFRIERIGDWVELNNFSFFITVFWIVGITNAINLIDGEDGLAGGVTLLSCLTLFFIYINRGIYEASFLSIILSGSILGFFIYNFPPAKIILGDTGSLPIGLLAAFITLLPLSQGFTDEIYYLAPIVALLVPIVDTALSFLRRILKGRNPFSRDRNHLHHRLIELGLSPLQSISILIAVSFYFDLIYLVPVYYINLLPNFVPLFFVFLIVNITGFLCVLKYFENKAVKITMRDSTNS